MGSTFPGATGLSEVTIYDWPGADGCAGGSPHMHTASTEAYVVLEGSGRLETLNSDGFTSSPLEPGVVLWFTPGTVHRAINDSGNLKVLVVMQNAGLPENGDAVMTFPPEHLADAEAYGRAAALEIKDADAGLAEGEEAARLVAPRTAAWADLLAGGAAEQAETTRQQLASLDAAESFYLGKARTTMGQRKNRRFYGMCGRIQTWELSDS